jgi:putative pyoverdin transport system ATP-binding/permease protein
MQVIPVKLLSFMLKRLRDAKRSRITIFLVVLLSIISGISNTALLAAINSKLSSDAGAKGSQVLIYATLCFVLPITRFAYESLLMRFAAGVVFDMRTQLCKQILSIRLRKIEELGPHRLLANVTDDVPAITNAFISFPILCMHISIVAGCLIYLGLLSWSVLMGVLVLVGIGIATYQVSVMRALKHIRLAREGYDTLMKHFRAVTQGTKELKLHRERRDSFFVEELEPSAHAIRYNNIKGNTMFIAATSWGQAVIFILIGLLLFGMPELKGVSAQTMTGYILALLYMMNPLQFILNTIPNLNRAGIALQRIEELELSLADSPVEGERIQSTGVGQSWKTLRLEGVTHAYQREGEEKDFVLGPIDLTFNSGELIFVGGGNGSGKTTFAKVLTGLYLPESGQISLDGVAVNDQNLESYRQLFSAVFYDFFLFERFLGLSDAEVKDKAKSYLAYLQLDHKVEIKEGMLSTTDLSQGQRKRLALLTAFLEDRSIYLFDEWASDQDPYFKEVFYHNILSELKARGKTVLVITHDDRYYKVADRIIKLDSGRVYSDQPVLKLTAAPTGIPAQGQK